MATVTSVTKHFPVPKEGFTTTTASTTGSGAATVSLNSVTGYTDGDTVVMVIEPASSSNKQAFTGQINTAGVQVINVVWTEGTNTSHAAGSTVVDYVAATHMAMVTKGLLRDHNQSGYHKSLNDNNAAVWIGQTSVASAVNQVTISNNVTVLPPKISATGSDTNIDLQIAGKGTGKAHVDGFSEIAYDFIISGGVWSGLGYGSTLTAAMTLVAAYINGQRLSSTTNSPGLAAVASRAFTASKDTYVDILNTAGVGTLVYTEVTNNAASPALAANSIRLAIVVTGATNIANVGSINQGQEDKVLPIVSSIAHTTTDALGNLICPRDPTRSVLGYRTAAAFSTASASPVQITGLSVPVIVPTGRRVKITVWTNINNNTGTTYSHVTIWDGTVNASTQLGDAYRFTDTVGRYGPVAVFGIQTPATTSKTYNVGLNPEAGGTAATLVQTGMFSSVLVELA